MKLVKALYFLHTRNTWIMSYKMSWKITAWQQTELFHKKNFKCWYVIQWHCQALKSGWALSTGDLGDRFTQRRPGEVWGQSLQKPDIYREFAAVKCFSVHVCCRVHPPSPPYPLQKNFGSVWIPWPKMAGQGGHRRWACAHPRLRYWCHILVCYSKIKSIDVCGFRLFFVNFNIYVMSQKTVPTYLLLFVCQI